MVNHKLDSIRIKAISACVPKNIEYTKSYKHFSQQEISSFEKHVGIKSRRCSEGKYTTSDLCGRAAAKLLADLHWQNDSIGLLLFISQTPDYTLPSTSMVLHNNLNLSKDCIALDIRLGCTGWVSGISIAASMMKTLNLQKALLLVGETNILSYYADVTTYPLMGDAGTATALELDPSATPIFYNSSSESDKYRSIIAPDSGGRYISQKNDPNIQLSTKTKMNGKDIFEYSATHVLPSIINLIAEQSLAIEDIDYIIFHQANKLIVESLRKKLNIPIEKCPNSLTEFGNTSSASIPLTILTQIKSFRTKSQKLLCCSFGVGLSLANIIIETDDLLCTDLIEI